MCEDDSVDASGDNIGDHDKHLMAADVDDRPCNEIHPSLTISILCKTVKMFPSWSENCSQVIITLL